MIKIFWGKKFVNTGCDDSHLVCHLCCHLDSKPMVSILFSSSCGHLWSSAPQCLDRLHDSSLLTSPLTSLLSFPTNLCSVMQPESSGEEDEPNFRI